MTPGEASEDDLIAGVERGLYIQRLWYNRLVDAEAGTVVGDQPGRLLPDRGRQADRRAGRRPVHRERARRAGPHRRHRPPPDQPAGAERLERLRIRAGDPGPRLPVRRPARGRRTRRRRERRLPTRASWSPRSWPARSGRRWATGTASGSIPDGQAVPAARHGRGHAGRALRRPGHRLRRRPRGAWPVGPAPRPGRQLRAPVPVLRRQHRRGRLGPGRRAPRAS